MKKILLAIFIFCGLSVALVSLNKPASSDDMAVAPCADDGADATKFYLGGRVRHRITKAPMPDVPIFLSNMPVYLYDVRTNTAPPEVEFETRTNADGEFWFCGTAWKSEYWSVIPSGNAYVYPGAVHYFDANKPGSYSIYFELKPML